MPEVLRAIRDIFAPEVVKCPVEEDDWKEVAQLFQDRWNVPHACGALDGKHVRLRCPANSGSEYHNYKGFFSVVLMALVDADYKFIWADVGATGHESDAQIFNGSELFQAIRDGTLNMPADDPLPNDDKDCPYFFLGDDAFALRTYMMKPYALRGMAKEQSVYNYRISRARRVVENAFGIMANRWRILLGCMQQGPEVVRLITEVCVVLHNLMRIRYPGQQNVLLDAEDPDHNLVPGAWRNDANMHDVGNVVAPNRDTKRGKQLREYLKLYFNSPAGSVPWQDRMVARR